METTKELRLAVLIDADNIPYSNVKGMLEEVAKYGTPTFKRIYGDWTKTTLTGWKSVLLENAITPIQQYSYTIGKNSSDSALIIDAMDILYSGKVDGFCIVSSDSDFTRLATRLREAGMLVLGIGEKKTPSSFISSCNKFIYIEILKQTAIPKAHVKRNQNKHIKKNTSVDSATESGFVKLVSDSINDLAEEDGWVYLGALGNLILKKRPDFDPRNFGYKKLIDMIRKIKNIEIDARGTGKNNIMHFYVKTK